MMKYLLGAGLTILTAGSSALALDAMPKRKPGLWEIRTELQGRPAMAGPVQTCVDEKSDNLMQQQADEAKQKCSAMDWKREGDRITVNSVCNILGTTTTRTTATFSGDLNSNYRGDIHTIFDPPIHGRGETAVTLYAKWLGPCKEGQKGGDIVLPGMGGKPLPNMQELMKMREQLKSMQNK